jgi:SAM-dependent methyltransferase
MQPDASSSSLPHGAEAPSAWVQRWSHLLPPGASVLDLACGHGRHMQWLATQGHRVTGVDRSPEALAVAGQWGEVLQADIENGPWPLLHDGQPRQFDALVVTNYLWRPLLPVIAASLREGGVLLYETFAAGNETVGKPSRPDFLLQPGELLRAFAQLRVVAYEDGFLAQPARFVQRLAAVRPANASLPARYPLGQC